MSALYNVFVPGVRTATVNISKITGGARLSTERPVEGTMYYGVTAASTSAALQAVQAMIGSNYSEAASVYLQSSDTRQQ